MPNSPFDLAAQPPVPRIDDAARERSVRLLSDAFARGALPMDELDSRMSLVYRAATQAELDTLVADLGTVAAPDAVPPYAVMVPQKITTLFSNFRDARVRTVSRTVRFEASFGSVEETALDVMPARLEISVFAGSVELDLRHTIFPPGMTEINVSAVMGGIVLFLPATVTLDNAGRAFLGTFEVHDETAARGSAASLAVRDRAYVRLTGHCMMGNVEIHHVPV